MPNKKTVKEEPKEEVKEEVKKKSKKVEKKPKKETFILTEGRFKDEEFIKERELNPFCVKEDVKEEVATAFHNMKKYECYVAHDGPFYYGTCKGHPYIARAGGLK